MDPQAEMLEYLAYNVGVVDDFLPDFQAVRDRALSEDERREIEEILKEIGE